MLRGERYAGIGPGRAAAVRQRRPPDRTRPLRRLGRLPARRRPRSSPSPDRAAARDAPRAARARSAEKPPHQVPPRVCQEPPHPLARALDLHPHRRGRADQQPRRARPARRRHLPQALPRQPIRPGRAHDRTTPLRLAHPPTPETLAPRLPHRAPQRQHPRRPHPRADPSSRGA
jgi:hypothetical protein